MLPACSLRLLLVGLLFLCRRSFAQTCVGVHDTPVKEAAYLARLPAAAKVTLSPASSCLYCPTTLERLHEAINLFQELFDILPGDSCRDSIAAVLLQALAPTCSSSPSQGFCLSTCSALILACTEYEQALVNAAIADLQLPQGLGRDSFELFACSTASGLYVPTTSVCFALPAPALLVRAPFSVCQPYTGHHCKGYLADATNMVYIPAGMCQQDIEDSLERLPFAAAAVQLPLNSTSFSSSVASSVDCAVALHQVVCASAFPPCDLDSTYSKIIAAKIFVPSSIHTESVAVNETVHGETVITVSTMSTTVAAVARAALPKRPHVSWCYAFQDKCQLPFTSDSARPWNDMLMPSSSSSSSVSALNYGSDRLTALGLLGPSFLYSPICSDIRRFSSDDSSTFRLFNRSVSLSRPPSPASVPTPILPSCQPFYVNQIDISASFSSLFGLGSDPLRVFCAGVLEEGTMVYVRAGDSLSAMNARSAPAFFHGLDALTVTSSLCSVMATKLRCLQALPPCLSSLSLPSCSSTSCFSSSTSSLLPSVIRVVLPQPVCSSSVQLLSQVCTADQLRLVNFDISTSSLSSASTSATSFLSPSSVSIGSWRNKQCKPVSTPSNIIDINSQALWQQLSTPYRTNPLFDVQLLQNKLSLSFDSSTTASTIPCVEPSYSSVLAGGVSNQQLPLSSVLQRQCDPSNLFVLLNACDCTLLTCHAVICGISSPKCPDVLPLVFECDGLVRGSAGALMQSTIRLLQNFKCGACDSASTKWYEEKWFGVYLAVYAGGGLLLLCCCGCIFMKTRKVKGGQHVDGSLNLPPVQCCGAIWQSMLPVITCSCCSRDKESGGKKRSSLKGRKFELDAFTVMEEEELMVRDNLLPPAMPPATGGLYSSSPPAPFASAGSVGQNVIAPPVGSMHGASASKGTIAASGELHLFVGSAVNVVWTDGNAYEARITRIAEDGAQVWVTFPDFPEQLPCQYSSDELYAPASAVAARTAHVSAEDSSSGVVMENETNDDLPAFAVNNLPSVESKKSFPSTFPDTSEEEGEDHSRWSLPQPPPLLPPLPSPPHM